MAFTTAAYAELELEVGGRVQSDIRARVTNIQTHNFYDLRKLPVGIERNENILKLKLGAYADRFSGVVDLDLVYLGRSPEVQDLAALSDRTKVEPFRIEAHSLYMQGTDVIVDGLDLRIGQQIVAWGAGDQFNPTNNINSDDLEDPLLFGTQQANLMAKADYSFGDALTLSGVLVPIFRPALLPASGELAVAAVDRLPHVNEALRHRIHVETAVAASDPAMFGERFPTRVRNISPMTPETSLENMQFSFRAATTLAEQDISVSYYRGFHDFPEPVRNDTAQVFDRTCAPNNAANCVDGVIETNVELAYPKMQVIGLNVTGEVNALGWLSDAISPIGYRIEAGLFFPEALTITMFQDDITVARQTVPAGEYAYNLGAGVKPEVLSDKPFAKWVVGLDYTFNEHVYANVQWVHGLVDEFGAGDFISDGYDVRAGGVSTSADPARTTSCLTFKEWEQCAREVLRPKLGDYLVIGLDFKFDDGQGLFRMFSILDVTPIYEEKYVRSQSKRVRETYSPFSSDGLSLVLYPEFNYNFGSGFEFGAGALIQLGKDYTKFGDPAAGGSVVWTRGRFSF